MKATFNMRLPSSLSLRLIRLPVEDQVQSCSTRTGGLLVDSVIHESGFAELQPAYARHRDLVYAAVPAMPTCVTRIYRLVLCERCFDEWHGAER
jgi:hypothetical protein